ncbi:hypothetical protein BZG82_10150 [Salinivibrio sp. PR5]|nr:MULTISPECIES: hypothetical protein [unclassified Salinivibrio]OOF08873.1 hypothetical protein BZG83_15645 [Salinivibrio sp. PR919]OOF09611.1 hypothetical protein BZG82_10150 [Salinivibrio sp. PR5]OOF17870.1 hypothetical protein BZG84_06095 [Salinivibrio sp. PR932]
MAKPNSEEISRFNRYFAIESNNEFWSLSESDLSQEEKKKLLIVAFSSLYHWSEVGTQENIELANLAIARALCINDSPLCIQFAKAAFSYFDGQGANWIQAFTNAVLSHSLLITGERAQAIEFYEKSLSYQLKLSEGDNKVFDATFKTIPDPRA